MKKILTVPIRFYQKHISPLTPPTCRYHPTCSTYALQAIEKHGAIKGGTMGLSRIIRCNPFVEGGVDEVPDYFTLGRNPANVNDIYIPGQNLLREEEIKKEISVLLEKYEDQLIIHEKLPLSMTVLKKIADVKILDAKTIEQEFSEEEFDYLVDIEVIPEFPSERFQYFTIDQDAEASHFTKEMEAFDEGVVLGEDFPLIVLEKTGIWYTNMPQLSRAFLLARGVTEEDLETKSYHLWLVLQALKLQDEVKK